MSVFVPNGRGVFRLYQAGELRSAERGDSPPPRRGKRVDTKVSTLLTPTSFYFVVRRRPETGDRFEKGNGSRVITACLS